MRRPMRSRSSTLVSPRHALALPDDAVERVLERHEHGGPSLTAFERDGLRIAEVRWDRRGMPQQGATQREGLKHGLEVRWYENGVVGFVDAYEHGQRHGLARHFDYAGHLLVETRFDRGTGVALACNVWDDGIPTLADEIHTVSGQLLLVRRWTGDDRTIWLEEHYQNGLPHGIFRAFGDDERLRRGWPRFFVWGERVDKRHYLAVQPSEPTLIPYRAEHDAPERTLPAAYRVQPACRHRLASVPPPA